MDYKRALKTDWKAKWIWPKSEESSKNVWICFNKKVDIDKIQNELIARIAAENKYWLYINGKCVIREGGLKRGPTPTGCYFDEVDIAGHLVEGENLISILVWYWGNEASYSSTDAGQGGLLFEAESDNVSILSDSSWNAVRNPAFLEDKGKLQPNYRLPESNVYYDARKEAEGWNKPGYDFSAWAKAEEYAAGGNGCWGETYSRDIPQFKDFGLKDYENSKDFEGKSFLTKKKITLKIPYNAQVTPYLEIEAKAGKKIVITTENTCTGSIHSTYVTKDGVQVFEFPAWFNGENITYEIPSGVKILSLKFRESGYNTEFCGSFTCDNEDMNTLWQKALRTLYVTMRDNFMDCPDRERAQWWGDVTNEMMLTVYSLAPSSYSLYRKGVSTMLSYIDPETKVLQTVVPIKNDYFELPCQQLAGVVGLWVYYTYTADKAFIESVYGAATDYINLWNISESGLVEHRGGSWDWQDWGDKIDVIPLENAWYYYALSAVKNMAELLGDERAANSLESRMKSLHTAYQSLWTDEGYRSAENKGYDDRGNAIAVLSGLCSEDKYTKIRKILFDTRNSSPYMEHYVLEALCSMGEFALAEKRMCERYGEMIRTDYSTLWENWVRGDGTSNHAWSGGPLVAMSKHIAGVKPLTPGYSKTEIKPQYDLHKRISCTVPAIIGDIKFDYVLKDNKAVINLEYPECTQINLHVPENAAVTANGKTVETSGNTVIIL
ncbi:MAG: alpha-L-rhamnosidase N-terminal domain-containing protein [Clostridia bacterium]|nr:alpha-L-rhamnosidase N-terminal domain-containing protein [Clostridia bacterium]